MSGTETKPWSYRDFLLQFQQAGYQFVFFNEINSPAGQLAMRHDIDFDTSFALQAARIEHELGIKATYFFLLRSDLYNVFTGVDYDNILAIKELGHSISIHFDPTLYTDFATGLQKEVQVFNTLFNTEVGIISIHRPNDFFLKYDETIIDIEHTYQSKYFKEIKYFADSTGAWRYGHPSDSEEFQANKTLHVLIHPIWWMVEGDTNLDKLRAYYKSRVAALNGHFYSNCIPFRQIHDQV